MGSRWSSRPSWAPARGQSIARIYAASGRVDTYLGDWHTHPGAGAYLSSTDLSTLHRIADCRTARAPTPLMIVLAGGPAWKVAGWTTTPAWRRFGRVRRQVPAGKRAHHPRGRRQRYFSVLNEAVQWTLPDAKRDLNGTIPPLDRVGGELAGSLGAHAADERRIADSLCHTIYAISDVCVGYA
ncbi:MAG: Mov34/MPN/PAD-1 family protein [Gemmatimonadetes bacterium]|nr:Mov34/MPN/PAD-1 family protein [Gemmatimonadota bacterium]